MNKEKIEGYSYQKYEPTPDYPSEIKSKKLEGLNLLNSFELNGIQYTDNIPDNMWIGVTKEQYCEYMQLQQENKQLKEEKEELKKWLEEDEAICYEDKSVMVLDKIKELEGEIK